MRPCSAWIMFVSAMLLLVSCAQTPVESAAPPASAPVPLPVKADATASNVREARLSGIIEAVRSSRVGVPQLSGQNNRMTLTRIIANGVRVEEGDVIAEFDALEQVDAARTARAKQEDLDHQIQQKAAQNRADAEKRRSDLQQADAILRKALLEVSKAEILPEIDKQQNRIRAEIAAKHLESLKVSQAQRDTIDASGLTVLELQANRQKMALDRAQTNITNLQLRAPLAGMVAHSVIYRNGSMTHVQEGDQLYRGNALVSIFDPSEMLVRCSVAEPDRVELRPGARATVYVDAYPDLALPAHFESASPIATTALGSPIKTFTALFRLDRIDPRLMPDLSAAVVIETAGASRGKSK
jgi:biotin carboxyl carrier protein